MPIQTLARPAMLLLAILLIATPIAQARDGVRAVPPAKPKIVEPHGMKLKGNQSKGPTASFAKFDVTPAGPKLDLKARTFGGCIKNSGSVKSDPVKVRARYIQMHSGGFAIRTSPDIVFPALDPGQKLCLEDMRSLKGMGLKKDYKFRIEVTILDLDAKPGNNKKAYMIYQQSGANLKFFTDN